MKFSFGIDEAAKFVWKLIEETTGAKQNYLPINPISPANVIWEKFMSNLIKVEFPGGTPREVIESFEKEIQQQEGVTDVGQDGSRGFDVDSLKVWIEIATMTVALAKPVLEMIMARIRDRNIKGVKFKVKGVEVTVDDIQPEDLEKILLGLRLPSSDSH